MTARGHRSGLTLLELLVALVVTGTALAMGAAAFHGVTDQRMRALRAQEESTRESLIRRTLGDWVRGAQLSAGGLPFTGVDGAHAGSPDDELVFLSTAPTLGDAGAAIVRLHIDRDDDTPERGLVAVLTEWQGTRTETIELAPKATALDIEYLFAFNGRRWLPSWISSSVLPLGVRITLNSTEPDALPPLLRYPILVALGTSR